MLKTCCLIPARNEAEQIARVVHGAIGFVDVVLVVDDGSTDQTASFARAAGADVLELPVSRGKGVALRAGLSRALEMGATVLILLDGDGQHDASEIPIFLKMSAHCPEEMIVGNRMHASNRMPWVRRWTNRIMSGILSAWTGLDVPDTQCGYRLIPASLARMWRLRSEHFEIESEMILQSAACGRKIHSVPVRCLYDTARKSQIMPCRDAWRWIRFMLVSGWMNGRQSPF